MLARNKTDTSNAGDALLYLSFFIKDPTCEIILINIKKEMRQRMRRRKGKNVACDTKGREGERERNCDTRDG